MAGLSTTDAAEIIRNSTDAAVSACRRAQDYVCVFGSIMTATKSAAQQAAVNARRRKVLGAFTSVPARRRLSAADAALLQIQVDALRSSMQAVEGAGYSKMAVSAAASQFATILGAGFAADYSASVVHDALSLAANLTTRYVRDCNSYTPDTDAVLESLVRGSLNLFSNEAGVNRTLGASLALRQLLSQLGRRSLECGTCAATRANWTSPVAAYASPSASRKDAELLPLQLCVSRTVDYPAQVVAFGGGSDVRIGLPSSFALSVLGNATDDRTLDVVALRLPAALYGGSERLASDVVQLAVYRAGCGASCESLPVADLSEALTFAGSVPAAAAFDPLSERISLSRFNVSKSIWTETNPGAIAVRGIDGRYASSETTVIPSGTPAAFHDIAHVVRTRPESRNLTSRATLGVAFELYTGDGNTSAAAVFAGSSKSDPAGLVAAIAARIRARAAAIGAAASHVATFDQALQLAVETGAIAPSAAGSVEGIQITFSFFGVANLAPGLRRPSSTALRDFVYADALLSGLDLSAVDPLLVGGTPQRLDGQRITSPGVPGIGGFRDRAGLQLPVVLSFPRQAATLEALQRLYPVSPSALGNPRLVRAALEALRSAVRGTSFAAEIAKSIDVQMAYVSADRDAESLVLTMNVFGGLLASPTDGGGFNVSATTTGPEAITRGLVYASLNSGLTLSLSDGSNLTGGTVRSIGGNFAGVAPYIQAVKAELMRSAAAVPVNASRLNFTVRVENSLGSFVAWLSENYDSLDAAARDDYWLMTLYNFLRQVDPDVSISGVQFKGRAAFADAVSNGTRRHALQLGITSSPSVDITGAYIGSSPVLGSGPGFSRNSSFCGSVYTIALPSGAATAKPQCTQNAIKAGVQTSASASEEAASSFDVGKVAGIVTGVVVGVTVALFVCIGVYTYSRRKQRRSMHLPRTGLELGNPQSRLASYVDVIDSDAYGGRVPRRPPAAAIDTDDIDIIDASIPGPAARSRSPAIATALRTPRRASAMATGTDDIIDAAVPTTRSPALTVAKAQHVPQRPRGPSVSFNTATGDIIDAAIPTTRSPAAAEVPRKPRRASAAAIIKGPAPADDIIDAAEPKSTTSTPAPAAAAAPHGQIAGEGLEYPEARGGQLQADLAELQAILNAAPQPIARKEQMERTRWGVFAAAALLKNNAGALEALTEAVLRGDRPAPPPPPAARPAPPPREGR
eukprot:tig00000076_g2449.t1